MGSPSARWALARASARSRWARRSAILSQAPSSMPRRLCDALSKRLSALRERWLHLTNP